MNTRNNIRFVPLLLIAVAAISVAPSSLLAHARLVKSEPAAGAKGPAPTRVRLTYSEEPVLAMTRLYLVSSTGDTVTLGASRFESSDEHVIVADVPPSIKAGTYTLSWSTAARDGHASKGSFSFTVEALAAAAPDSAKQSGAAAPAPAATTKQTIAVQATKTGVAMSESTNSVGAVLIRFLGYVSLFVLVGAVTFKLFVLARAGGAHTEPFMHVASTSSATIGMFASVGVLIATILKVNGEFADMPGMSVQAMMFSSSWGYAQIVAGLASILALVALWRAHSASGTNTGAWRAAQFASVVLVIAPAFGAHAASSDEPWLTIPVDVIHVAAGAMWLGTLAVILLVGISAVLKSLEDAAARSRIAALINVFSPMALVCGGAVVVTGSIAAFIHLPHINSLWTTSYGSALYRKLIFVLLLMLVGAWNWKRTRPRLEREDGLAPLRRVATLEVTLAAIVLVLTAILVALELP